MKEITEWEFFSKYPTYQNFNELKKSDILIMPLDNNGDFGGRQQYFSKIMHDPSINCRYYSKSQESIPVCLDFAAISPSDIFNFGVVVISSVAGLIKIYEFLKKSSDGHRFKIKHVLAIKEGFLYEMDEFEGTIDEYNATHQKTESLLKKT